jgi:uncharacterized membrane protein HdeD (DUF308 family)
VRFKQTHLENSKLSYSLLLFTFPLYYLIFAIYNKDYEAASFEIFVGLLFFTIAILSFNLSTFYRFGLLTIGYLLHGVYDVAHNVMFVNTGTPGWWPEFCGVIDIFIGLYLAYLTFSCRILDSTQAVVRQNQRE